MARKKKSKMFQWAEHEVGLACRRKRDKGIANENGKPDYAGDCYDVALAAFKKCTEGNLDSPQFQIMTGILERLLHGLPLTSITESDFDDESISPDEFEIIPWYADMLPQCDPSYMQCSRCDSVFKIRGKDGEVMYTDFNRGYFVNIDNPADVYSSDLSFLDEMYPIKMPYFPKNKKFVIYERRFIADERNIDWDYDTVGTIYMLTPDGERVDLNIYRTVIDGNLVRISKEDFEALYEKRIDKKQDDQPAP